MKITCGDIADYMEEIAPSSLAEKWDNTGLLIGSRSNEVKRVLVCLDIGAAVVDEAAEVHAGMIISHHPVIFEGLKSIDTGSAKGRCIESLIKNCISVFCAHTNLDFADSGVNEQLARVIGLTDIKDLNPDRTEKLYKIVVFVPAEAMDSVRNALCISGAGHIGNYSNCTFAAGGTGTFMPLEGTNPYAGKKGRLEKTGEFRLETIISRKLLAGAIRKMLAAHPYEEVAYDVYPLELPEKRFGLGKSGRLPERRPFKEFVGHMKEALHADTIRVIGPAPEEVEKAAVFCGSFDGNYSGILRERPDVLVTGDIKYHTAVEIREMGICVIDAGHYATERVIVKPLAEKLHEGFEGLECICSVSETEPYTYY